MTRTDPYGRNDTPEPPRRKPWWRRVRWDVVRLRLMLWSWALVLGAVMLGGAGSLGYGLGGWRGLLVGLSFPVVCFAFAALPFVLGNVHKRACEALHEMGNPGLMEPDK